MEITEEQLLHLERLARIELTPEERAGIRRDLEQVLGYFQTLAELDLEGVEEMVRPVPTTNVMREDEVGPSLPREVVKALAVEEQDGFFRVPRMLDDDGG